MTPANEPPNRGDEPRRGPHPLDPDLAAWARPPAWPTWIDRLPAARAHREVRLHADANGLSFWRDWHHAWTGCCGWPAWWPGARP